MPSYGKLVLIVGFLSLFQAAISAAQRLEFRPLPPDDQAERTLIRYKGTDKENYKYWTDSLQSFLAVYRTPGLTPGRGQNVYNCDYNKPPPKGGVCDVDVKNWAPCTPENDFYYHKSAPCIFLMLNKIPGWVPAYYNDTQNLPTEMPDDLRSYIRNISNPSVLNTIWVSCEGENPADVENIGPIGYYPRRGFPGYYFPNENDEAYLSPLVAIHLERPTTGILINIECKAWAKNIKHDRDDKLGSVHFELLID